MDNHIIGEVAFHLVGEQNNFKNQPDMLSLQKLFTIACTSTGIGPCRLSEWKDIYFINQWLKNSKRVSAAAFDINLMKQLGGLLAKVHLIDPNWYTPHYEKLLAKYPALNLVPRGSSFWYLTTRNWPLACKKEHTTSMESWMNRISETFKDFIELEIQPMTTAGKRIVSTHGDFDPTNILISEEGILNVIDFEQAHVSFAIQDMSYFFMNLPNTSCKEYKMAFCSAYLSEMGYQYEESDVFALALDAERCTLSTGFDSTLFESFVKNEEIRPSNRKECYQLKIFADSLLEDKELAEEVVTKGIWKCLPFVCLGNKYDIGVLLTVNNFDLEKDFPEIEFQDSESDSDSDSRNPRFSQKSRCSFLINGDGTIMPKYSPRWKGLVLGTNKCGDIVLTNHCNKTERLELSGKIMKSIPINGFSVPKSKPFPLLLKGGFHSGKSIVRSKITGTWFGNVWFRLAVGKAEEAIQVHFERDGAIRFADSPEQAFDCDDGKHTPGTKVNSYQYQGAACQRFVRNIDDTISPQNNLDVILGMGEHCLQLCTKEYVKPSDLLIFDIPAGIGLRSSLEECDTEPLDTKKNEFSDSTPVRLILDNPKGKGINVRPLKIDSNLLRYIDPESQIEELSKLKLYIDNESNAATAVIDPTEFYIKIVNINGETDHPDLNASTKGNQFVCLGVWN